MTPGRNLNSIFIFLIFLAPLLNGCNQTEDQDKYSLVSLDSPSEIQSAQPSLYSSGDELLLSWQQNLDSVHILYYSKMDKDGKWENPKELAKGSNWFVNWADYPTITTNKENMVISNYLPKSGSSTYAYNIQLAINKPDTTFKLHDDTTQTEHGFVSASPVNDTNIIVVWLDGRNTASSGHEHHGAMTLRAAIVDERGHKTEEWLLDDKVCDCCQTDVVVTDEGPVVVYRNRSNEEIRDIFYTRYIDGAWSTPQPVASDDWKIAGCPVNGPRISANEKKVAVAYFTAADNKPRVKLAVSNDYGASFNDPIVVDSVNAIGRVDVEVMENGDIWVSWMKGSGKEAVLNVAKFSNGSTPDDIVEIAQMRGSRNSGFPQMEKLNNDLYFAWTDSGDTTTIKLKRLEYNN